MLRKQTIGYEVSFESLAHIAGVLHIDASPASGMTYSAESAGNVVSSLFKWFKDLMPSLSKLSGFKPTEIRAIEILSKRLDNAKLMKIGSKPIPIQDGLQVSLAQWIETLDSSYTKLLNDLEGGLQGLLSLFGVLVNNPDEIKNLSRYGKVERSKVKEINTEFQAMFGSSKRSNRVTLSDLVPNADELNRISTSYTNLYETRKGYDTETVKEKITRITELSNETIERYGLRLSQNRRAVSDLAGHVETIAEAVSLLSNLDYSYQVLENTLKQIERQV